MSHDRDSLAARISGWLSEELDPVAADAVARRVAADPEAGRIAGGYRRVDAVVRDWYDALPLEPAVRPTVAAFRPPQPARVRNSLVAAIAASLMVAPWIPAVSAKDVARLIDRVKHSVLAADDEDVAPRFEPSAYWVLRPLAEDWIRPPGRGDRERPAAAAPEPAPPRRS
jgi:hypothetical protein